MVSCGTTAPCCLSFRRKTTSFSGDDHRPGGRRREPPAPAGAARGQAALRAWRDLRPRVQARRGPGRGSGDLAAGARRPAGRHGRRDAPGVRPEPDGRRRRGLRGARPGQLALGRLARRSGGGGQENRSAPDARCGGQAAPQALPLGGGVRLRPRARTDHTIKITLITLPSPSLYANFWSPEFSGEAYPTLDGFLEDVAEILREEVEELVRLGATYIQLDAPHYPLLLDPTTREFYERRGWDFDRWMSRGVELDNHVMGSHPGVTFAFRLCRVNQGSRWLVSGSYEPLARRIFERIRADRLMLEYDDERSGGFEPLAYVPEDK